LIPWLGFTVEAIASPFSDDNDVELEFESNFHWLTESMTREWVTSHFDVVDQFSPAERPDVGRAYTHKLDFELDTALHMFKWLPEDRWLRDVEFETSLDYLATGIPKEGDLFPDGSLFLDDASHWSLSFVFVIPVAPFSCPRHEGHARHPPQCDTQQVYNHNARSRFDRRQFEGILTCRGSAAHGVSGWRHQRCLWY
jgi:hypothetical protein